MRRRGEGGSRMRVGIFGSERATRCIVVKAMRKRASESGRRLRTGPFLSTESLFLGPASCNSPMSRFPLGAFSERATY